MTSEWDPILRPNMDVYAELRINDGRLELQFDRHPNITVSLDAKVIPQLIKILERMERRV